MSKNILLGCKLLFALLFFSVFIYWSKGLPLPGGAKVEISVLAKEAMMIKPPLGAVLMYRTESHKGSSALVASRYQTSLNSGQVFEYYREILARAGWRQTGGGNGLREQYCKGALDAEIEFNRKLKFYTFSVSWWRRSRTICES